VSSVAAGARPWVGRGLPRLEDERFVTGEAQYVGDMKLPEMVHAAFVRSFYAHGRIVAIDAEMALGMPGVRAVLIAADAADLDDFPLVVRSGEDVVRVMHPVLASEFVHYVGQPIALVVADTAEQAADAAENVLVEVNELPPVIEARAAQAAQPLHECAPDNVLLRQRKTTGDVDGAFAGAHAVVGARIVAPRLIAAPIEPRAVLASYDGDVLTLWLSAQDQHRQLNGLTVVLRRPPDKLRIVVPDVGGAFGSKGVPQAETAAVALAALRVGRPVKWEETRTESSLAVYQGRGQDVDAELALDADGRMLALRARILADLGAYLYSTTTVAPLTTAQLLTGCYDIACAAVEVVGVCTNKVPTGPYRGAGRPEAALVIERLVDLAAHELGIDPIELRRRNVIPRDAFPYENALGFTYDSGDYEGALEAALELARYDELQAAAERARAAGRLAGVGIALYVERVGPGWETASVCVHEDGHVVVRTGSSPHGQGHETTFAQIAADALGIDPAGVEVRYGDSFEIPEGMGTFASRSVTVGGSAIVLAAREARERLEAGERAPVETAARFELPGPVFAFGAYVAAVEIERETGEVTITRIAAVDDCGHVINPLLAEGQVVGAVVQAVGEVLFEEVGYDEDGQPLAVNLYDYHVPTSQNVPPIVSELRETPSPWNPLGAKGVGEGGSIGTPAAVANAVADALAKLGIRHLNPPFTPSRVWTAIRDA
jgi:carbon-monoxide dehydrogenase large subunit